MFGRKKTRRSQKSRKKKTSRNSSVRSSANKLGFFGRLGKRVSFVAKIVSGVTTLACLAGLIFICDPNGYAAAQAWRDNHVVVAIAPSSAIKNVVDNLTDEDFKQIHCLAVNSYFEARSEGETGIVAVDNVVINRVKHGIYPEGPCQVVYETKRDPNTHKVMYCQFSWTCDNLNHDIKDKESWTLAYNVAYNTYVHNRAMPDFTNGATFYHADYVDPKHGVWKKGNLKETTQIGRHIFFTKNKR